MKRVRFNECAPVLMLAVLLATTAAAQTTGLTKPPAETINLEGLVEPSAHGGAYMIENKGGVTSCRAATREEAEVLKRRPRVPLHVIYGGGVRTMSHQPGLSITLRSTQQLEQFPQAKAAFQAAAARWEAVLQNPIDVIIDVDFGPTRFGEPYPSEDILGSTDSDERGGDVYSQVRSLLISGASSGAETSLYNSLPSGSLSTNLGSTSRVFGASILLRGLGGLAPVQPATDPAPSVGFNSAFPFDFDPSNGINSNQTDFDAVAVHEIGHALGFNSLAGFTELEPSQPPTATPWDFFRFRPGITLGGFSTAQRILSSGGTQVYFDGAAGERQLATGRPDGTGGDEQQSSHWKDDADSGVYIGIMDPTLPRGSRQEMTSADLAVLEAVGYRVSGSTGPPTGCSEVEPNDTAALADTLSVPGSCSGNAASTDSSSLSIRYDNGQTDGIEDFFRFTLSQSGRVEVTLTFTNSGADLDVFLGTISGSTLTVIALSNGSSTTERISTTSDLQPGTYFVGVSAFQGSSAYTVSVSSTGAPATPAAPTNLTATATSSSVIRLNWTDNSNNETQFRVEQKVGSSFQDIGSVSANATTVNVTGLNAGTNYTFRVKARNAAGDSGYSNEANATTAGGGPGPGTCTPGATTLCLSGSRFQVQARYRTPDGQTGDAQAVPITADTGYFWFFDAANIEVIVKLLNACSFANRFWVFGAGLTNVEVTLTITDMRNGTVKTYTNPQGTAFQPVQDTNAFATCP